MTPIPPIRTKSEPKPIKRYRRRVRFVSSELGFIALNVAESADQCQLLLVDKEPVQAVGDGYEQENYRGED